MLRLRPIHLEDLDQLMALATLTGFGLTTLPRDAELLRDRIVESQTSFERMSKRPRGETYLFVLEDLKTGKVVGTCGIVSKVGGFEPFYAYRVETSIHESEMLSVRKEIQLLQLVKEHNGPSEIGSLFLSPEYRGHDNGRLLSLGRFLFMAEHLQRFDPIVIAEMRGVIDDRGHSPFWDAIGKHFFEIDFPKADYLSMVNKKFIADLMPTHPIYVPLLPIEAQAVIGKVHAQTEPALKMLRDEGFRDTGEIDIFEGGPVVSCALQAIRAIKESRRAVVGDVSDDLTASEDFLICHTRKDFGVCKGAIELSSDDTIRLDSRTALCLGVKVGDTVRFTAIRPAPAADSSEVVAADAHHEGGY
jgi:arginine N-succinyltransferase